MRIFFGKHYGKDTSEVDSGYLLFIIEKLESADYSLIQSCKAELFSRLKLDWQPPTPETQQIETLKAKLQKSQAEVAFLFDVIGMSTICKGNPYIIDGYLHNRKYMYEVFKQIKEANQQN